VHGAEAAKDSAGLRYDPDILDLADVGVRTAQLCYRTFSRASSSLPSRRAAPRRAAPRDSPHYARSRIKGTACAVLETLEERWCRARVIFQRHRGCDAAKSESRQIVQLDEPLIARARATRE
jgi:hypothetical protein